MAGKPPAGKKTPNQGASTVITIQEGANRGQGATSAASASNATSKYGTPRESFTGAGRLSGSRPGSRRQSRTSTPGASATANRNMRAKSAEERVKSAEERSASLPLNKEAQIRKKEIENKKKKNEENKKKKNEENKKNMEKEIEIKKNEETTAALLERLGAHTIVTRERSTSEPWGRRRGGSFQSIQKVKTSTGSEPARRPSTCLLYTSPSPRDLSTSRMPSSA